MFLIADIADPFGCHLQAELQEKYDAGFSHHSLGKELQIRSVRNHQKHGRVIPVSFEMLP